jgi:hypothetical protein
LPELDPPIRGEDWQLDRPTYWVDDLQLKMVVTWPPDERSCHFVHGSTTTRRPG